MSFNNKKIYKDLITFPIMNQYEWKFDLKTKKVTVTYGTQSSNFVLYLESISCKTPEFHIIHICPQINIGQSDLYFTVQWFCLVSWMIFCV